MGLSPCIITITRGEETTDPPMNHDGRRRCPSVASCPSFIEHRSMTSVLNTLFEDCGKRSCLNLKEESDPWLIAA